MANTKSPAQAVDELKTIIDAHDGREMDRTTQLQAMEQCRILLAKLSSPGDLAYNIVLQPTEGLCNKVAVDAGIYEALNSQAGSLTTEELAEVVKVEPVLLQRIMRQLAALTFVDEVSSQTFRANETTKKLGTPSMQANTTVFWDHVMPTFVQAPAYFQKQGYKNPQIAKDTIFNFAHQTDFSYFEWLNADAKRMADFSLSMDGNRGGRPRWTGWFPAKEKIVAGTSDQDVLFVDVAGGYGWDLEAFLDVYPEAKAGQLVLQEQPSVIKEIKGLDGRIRVMEHDFFTEQPIKGAKVYHMSRVLHDWGDLECARILRPLVAAMSRDSRLYIQELVLPDTGASTMQCGLDWAMMTLCAGAQRSRVQWTALLANVGLDIVEFHVGPSNDEGIIEGKIKTA